MTARPARTRLEPPADGIAAAALAAGVLTLDLLTESYYANFDGVACAIAIESGNFRHLAHGNHVLYGLLGYVFDAAWRAVGYSGPALLSLAVLNRLLHAACAATAYLLFRRLGATRFASLAGSCGLAFSFGAWFYGLEPHVYSLGLLGLLGASCLLFTGTPRPAAAGALHALAIGGHVTHLLAIPCFAWWLGGYAGGRDKVRRYLAALGLGCLAVYLLGILAVRPHSAQDLFLWLSGTAAIGPSRAFSWHGPVSPAAWAGGLVRVVWAQDGSWGPGFLRGTSFWVQSAATAWMLLLGFSAWKRRERFSRALAVWLGAYFLFFSTWEPGNINYHLGDLVPLWSLFVLALEDRKSLGELLLVITMSAVQINNLELGIRPLVDPAANSWLTEAKAISRATPEDAWIATGDDLGKVYLPYFAHRKPLILAESANRPEALSLKEPVFVPERLLADPRWGPKLRTDFDLERVSGLQPVLYRLEPRQPRIN